MRYCLACRNFSADGPLCTQCGRSFAGRLCNSKKRHLNPPDAQFCGQCGTPDLIDAAAYVPLGCSGRLVAGGLLLGLLWWGSSLVLSWGGQGFYRLTGFYNPGIWLIEKSAGVLITLFVFYFLSMFMPGAAGEQFRNLLSKICFECLRAILQLCRYLLKLISHAIFK